MDDQNVLNNEVMRGVHNTPCPSANDFQEQFKATEDTLSEMTYDVMQLQTQLLQLMDTSLNLTIELSQLSEELRATQYALQSIESATVDCPAGYDIHSPEFTPTAALIDGVELAPCKCGTFREATVASNTSSMFEILLLSEYDNGWSPNTLPSPTAATDFSIPSAIFANCATAVPDFTAAINCLEIPESLSVLLPAAATSAFNAAVTPLITTAFSSGFESSYPLA